MGDKCICGTPLDSLTCTGCSEEEIESLTARVEELEGGESGFYYSMAKYAAERWEKDVRRRPEVNVYRAGMDKAWKTLEAYCLEKREEIDAALAAKGGEDG